MAADANEIPTLPPLPASVPSAACPEWNLQDLAHRPCPVCGEDSSRPVCRRPDGLVVTACAGCRMLYVTEIPKPEAIEDFYRTYARFKFQRHRKTPLSRGKAWRQSLRDPVIQILAATGGLEGRSLLDVGSSYGRFLQLARAQGAVVHGVELDEAAVEFLRKIGIPAGRTVSSEPKMDIVCAFNLLEHLPNPSEILPAISKALKDDGRFLISVPNAADYGASGPYWIGFRKDLEHLNYFTVESLSRLLARYDLYVEQFWVSHQPEIERPRAGLRRGKLARWIMGLLARPFTRARRDVLSKCFRPCYLSGSYELKILARKSCG